MSVPAVPAAPRTVRDRVREEITREILTAARAHLTRDGAAALSLRSVARDLGMAPSALYRYYASRDALLSALILSAYESLADEAERAAAAGARRGGGEAERWLAVPRAMRAWALAHPNEWGLIFGTPVPGYEAPEDTVVPYARLASALMAPVAEAARGGRVRPRRPTTAIPAALADAVAPVTEALFLDVAPETVVGSLQVWTELIGAISLELFGHWRRTILDPGAFFEQSIADMATTLGLT